MPGFFNNASDYLLVANVLNSIFCLMILVFIRFALETKTDSASRRGFKRFVIIVAVCLAADMCGYIFDMQLMPAGRILNHVSMFVSVLLTVYIGYSFNNLFDLLFHIKRTKKNRVLNKLLWFSPTAIMFVLLVLNLFFGFLYEIDEFNVYHRGNLYIISFVLQYISFAYAILRGFRIKSKVANSPLRREKMRRTVIGFGFSVLTFGALQAATGGKVSVHCLGLTAGVIIMFVRFLQDRITQDRLTNLNNRYALDSYMIDRIESFDQRASNHRLYLIFMDVNDFKAINDHYGHLEGDNALRVMGEVLRHIALNNDKRLFVARYGGDEFVALLEGESEADVQDFINQLNANLAQRNMNLEYDISVCFGYSIYRGEGTSVSDWVREADHNLYENKSRRAKNRTTKENSKDNSKK